MICLFIIALLLPDAVRFTIGFPLRHILQSNQLQALQFKKNSDLDKADDNSSFLDGLKSFIPGLIRPRVQKTYDSVPLTDSGNKYQVRLLKQSALIDRRHVVTRIMRFFPGTTWETASEIYVRSIDEGCCVIRVFNSLNDVKYVVDMMTLADPPIAVDVYDTQKGETLPVVVS